MTSDTPLFDLAEQTTSLAEFILDEYDDIAFEYKDELVKLSFEHCSYDNPHRKFKDLCERLETIHRNLVELNVLIRRPSYTSVMGEHLKALGTLWFNEEGQPESSQPAEETEPALLQST